MSRTKRPRGQFHNVREAPSNEEDPRPNLNADALTKIVNHLMEKNLGGSDENQDWVDLKLKHTWLTSRTNKNFLPHLKTDGPWKWDRDNNFLLAPVEVHNC